MNLITAIAEEDRKVEEATRRNARLRSVSENGNGNLAQMPITSAQYYEAKYPELSEQYGVPVLEEVKNRTVSVVGINEAFFAATLGEKGNPKSPLVYLPTEGRFYQYSDEEGIYKYIRDPAIATRVSQDFLECVQACKGGNSNTDALEFRLRDHKKLIGIVNTAKGQLEVPSDFFSGNRREFIAFDNGVLRVNDNVLLPFGSQYRQRNKLAMAFDPSAKCPAFLRFLHEALEDEDIDTLQKYFGQLLTGENISQKILLLVGLAGTGKTTLIKIVRGVIGPDNFAMLRTNLLTERFEIGRCFAKTVLYAPDVNGDFLNHKGAAVLKSLTGHDPMTVEFKNSNESPSMVGNFNVLITCNSRLVVRLEGDVEAWRRRLIDLNFHKPKPEKVIADLDRQILTTEGPGVLNWMLEGLEKLRADNWQLNLTAAQQATIDNLLLESDGHQLFIKNELVQSENSHVTVTEVFNAYAEYANQRGWLTINRNKFGQIVGDIVLRHHGKTTRNDVLDLISAKAQRGWYGLALRANSTVVESKRLKFDDPEKQAAWDSWEDPTK